MSSLAIVTDSTANLPAEWTEQHGVTVIPIIVNFGQHSYQEGVDIQADQFYAQLSSSAELPTTSQPSLGDLAALFAKLVNAYDQVLVILFSSGLSGTYQTALTAARMTEGDITIIDSRITSFGLAELVREAVRLREEGQAKEAIVARLEALIDRMQAYFILDSLDHLQRGGRLSKAQALVGSLLQIKPILMVDQAGRLDVFEKVRTKRKAIDRLLERLREQTQGKKARVGVVYANNREEGEALQRRIEEELPHVECSLHQLGPVIGTHTGPGLLAIVFYTLPEEKEGDEAGAGLTAATEETVS